MARVKTNNLFAIQLKGLKLLFITLLSVSPLLSYSQKKLEIIHAGSLRFDESLGNGAKRLIKDVEMKHEDVLMFCDSAYFYSDNTLEAFSRVHIQQNDTIHIYGDHLKYNGNDKKAIITGNVVVHKGNMQLFTNMLNYDLSSSVGYYTDKGRIIDKENVLTSQQGYLYSITNDLYFKQDVVLTHQAKEEKKPGFVINCDTMRYSTSTKITYFYGPTTIKSDNSLIYCEDGWYNTNNELSRFSKNSYIIKDKQKMFGDTVFYNGEKNIGEAFTNVQIIDTAEHTIIKGDYAIHYESRDLSIITGNALLIKIFETDTLFLHADTLKAFGENQKQKTENRKHKRVETEKADTNHLLFAYHKVKFFKSDLQGKCDSMVYSIKDSTMKLFGKPVFWSTENQLTADSAVIYTGNKTIKSLELKHNAFIASQKDSVHYNQIRGKKMHGFFKNNKLYLIKAKGNGQTIYYVEDGGQLTGVNRAECSNLDIYLEDQKINRIVFITKPDATLYPLEKIDVTEFRLKGFKWRMKERPLKSSDVFVW